MEAMEALSGPAPNGRTRAAGPGTTLTLLVLADGPEGCACIDMSSGALVRAPYSASVGSEPAPPLSLFDVVRAHLADDPDGPDPTQPEGVTLSAPPQAVGRARKRRARHLIEALLLPDGAEPFGFPGSAAQYWTVPGDRPSLAVLAPQKPPVLLWRTPTHLACRFGWRGVDLELPVADPGLREAVAEAGPRVTGRSLARCLGFSPEYLLLALSAPQSGRCYKVVAGLLPRP